MSDGPSTLEKAPNPSEKISSRLSRLAELARNGGADKNQTPIEVNRLRIIPLNNSTPALFLYGTVDKLKKLKASFNQLRAICKGKRKSHLLV